MYVHISIRQNVPRGTLLHFVSHLYGHLSRARAPAPHRPWRELPDEQGAGNVLPLRPLSPRYAQTVSGEAIAAQGRYLEALGQNLGQTLLPEKAATAVESGVVGA